MKDYRAPFNGNEKLYHQIRVYERQHINVYADQKAPELDRSVGNLSKLLWILKLTQRLQISTTTSGSWECMLTHFQ